MENKKLISPEFRITVGEFILSDGIEVECFSSKESNSDWCKIELSTQLQGMIQFQDMDDGLIELGYEDDFDTLLQGYIRVNHKDYWKEILMKDAMILLERIRVKATFVDCTPQDVVLYILGLAGITAYQLSSVIYSKKNVFVIDNKNGIDALKDINSAWRFSNHFYFHENIFYWGCQKEQDIIYTLEESETILSMKKYGELWEIETIGIPWIHHSQCIEVNHSKYKGLAEVHKTIIKSDNKGFTRMYIYFKGGASNV